MRRFQITIAVLLAIVLVLLWVVRHDVGDQLHQSVQGEKISAEEVLRMAFLDVGQGDATLIEFPDGTTMLVDCAKDARVLEALGRVMSFYERRIDYLVVTHPDADHYGGCIDVMRRFDIGHIAYNGFTKDNAFWEEFMTAIEEEVGMGAEYIEIEAPTLWHIGNTALHILYPDRPVEETGMESNDSSIVLKLSIGEQDILMTGDAEAAAEEYLLQAYGDVLDVEILKAGHHGSNTSSIEEFVKMTSPELTIVSAGKDNAYGHPSPRVLKRLERAGNEILRTDQNSDILITITPKAFYVE